MRQLSGIWRNCWIEGNSENQWDSSKIPSSRHTLWIFQIPGYKTIWNARNRVRKNSAFVLGSFSGARPPTKHCFYFSNSQTSYAWNSGNSPIRRPTVNGAKALAKCQKFCSDSSMDTKSFNGWKVERRGRGARFHCEFCCSPMPGRKTHWKAKPVSAKFEPFRLDVTRWIFSWMECIFLFFPVSMPTCVFLTFTYANKKAARLHMADKRTKKSCYI